MTWPEFGWDVASNTIATAIGVLLGVPAALGIERFLQRRRDVADARRRNEQRGIDEEQLRVRRVALVGLFDRSLKRNLAAIGAAVTTVQQQQPVFTSYIELQTWDVLKPQLVELIDDIELVAELAQYFAEVGIFVALFIKGKNPWTPCI